MKKQTRKTVKKRKQLVIKQKRKVETREAFIKDLLFRNFGDSITLDVELPTFRFIKFPYDPVFEENIALLTEQKMSRILFRRF